MMKKGEFEKLRILAFSNKTCTKQIAIKGVREFTVPVNPESYVENLKNQYDKKRGQGKQGTNVKYKSSPPSDLSLEFVLDGTNTIEGYKPPGNKTTVQEQVDLLKDFVYKINGKINKPNFLKILWGKKAPFCSVCTSLNINYVLFRPNGEPLRAKVQATFLEYKELEREDKLSNKAQKEVTEVLKKKAEEPFSTMISNKYGSPDNIIEVARANNLTSIRIIPLNIEIILPPIQNNIF